MISVLIQSHNQETELARTLSALVPGAVDGLICDVTVFDDCSEDGTAKVADAAGCNYHSISELAAIVPQLRGEWILLIEPGARPLTGWVESLGDHVANTRASAKMTASKTYKLPFFKRFFRRASPLEYGLLMPKGDAIAKLNAANAANTLAHVALSDIAKGRSKVKLNCEIVPAAFAQV